MQEKNIMYEPTDYIKTCPGCDTEYEANRLNQTFCTPKCKNRYHNNIQRAERMRRAEIQKITKDANRILWKNREVLKERVGRKVKLEEVEKIGFKRNYITQFRSDGEDGNQLFCYDYGYEFIDNQTIKIIENE